MENKLICPMSFCIQMGTIKYLFCEKEKCAWWDKGKRGCIIMVISDLNFQFYRIANKMNARFIAKKLGGEKKNGKE